MYKIFQKLFILIFAILICAPVTLLIIKGKEPIRLQNKFQVVPFLSYLKHDNTARSKIDDLIKHDTKLEIFSHRLITLAYKYMGGSILKSNYIIPVGNKHLLQISNPRDRELYGCVKNMSPVFEDQFKAFQNVQTIASMANMKVDYTILPVKSLILSEKIKPQFDYYYGCSAEFIKALKDATNNMDIDFLYDEIMELENTSPQSVFFHEDGHWNGYVTPYTSRFLASKIYNIPMDEIPSINLTGNYQYFPTMFSRKLGFPERLEPTPELDTETFMEFLKNTEIPEKTIVFYNSFSGPYHVCSEKKCETAQWNVTLKNLFEEGKIGAAHLNQAYHNFPHPLYPKFTGDEDYNHLIILLTSDITAGIAVASQPYGYIGNYVVNQHRKKAQQCSQTSKDLVDVQLELRNIEQTDFVYKSQNNDPQIVMQAPKEDADLCVAIQVFSPVNTQFEVFYDDNYNFQLDRRWSYNIKPGINEIYFMINKDFAGKYFRIDPINGQADFNLDIKIYKDTTSAMQ